MKSGARSQIFHRAKSNNYNHLERAGEFWWFEKQEHEASYSGWRWKENPPDFHQTAALKPWFGWIFTQRADTRWHRPAAALTGCQFAASLAAGEEVGSSMADFHPVFLDWPSTIPKPALPGPFSPAPDDPGDRIGASVTGSPDYRLQGLIISAGLDQ